MRPVALPHGCARGGNAARVVRATRFDCTTDTTPDASREAFTRLHKLFPQSEWAKRTPYWFR